MNSAWKSSSVMVKPSVMKSERWVTFLRDLGLEVLPGEGDQGLSTASIVEEVAKERCVVAVTGTHGRGTVAGMLVSILEAASQEPGYLLSTAPTHLKGAVSGGSGRVLVIEVDGGWDLLPSRGADIVVCSFLSAGDESGPEIARRLRELLIGGARLREAFFNLDCRQNRSLVATLPLRPTGYSMEHRTEYEGQAMGSDDGAAQVLGVYRRGRKVSEIPLAVRGDHNAINALGAVAVARRFGIKEEDIARGLSTFEGLRPSEKVIVGGGVEVRALVASSMPEVKDALSKEGETPHGERWLVVSEDVEWAEAKPELQGRWVREGEELPAGKKGRAWLMERVEQGDQIWLIGGDTTHGRAERLRAQLASRAESTPEAGEQPRLDGPLNE